MTLPELQKQALQLPISDRSSVGTSSFGVSKTRSTSSSKIEKLVSIARNAKSSTITRIQTETVSYDDH